MIAFAEQPQGPAKNVDAAVLAGAFGDAALPCQNGMVEIVVNVAWNKEVEQAVAVVIAPCCSGGPAAENDASLLGDISERDRKSTRLNSSHLGISYAVFCLKKKKKKKTQKKQRTNYVYYNNVEYLTL